MSDPSLPFVMLHNKIRLRPRTYVRLPIRFVPVFAGRTFTHTLEAVSDITTADFKKGGYRKYARDASDETVEEKDRGGGEKEGVCSFRLFLTGSTDL